MEEKTIESILQSITGYLISINRDTVKGWYYLQIGLPNKWVFSDNKLISCEILNESEQGKLLKIAPKDNTSIIIDDLIRFVEIIIETNMKIVEREKEFEKRIEEIKVNLEKDAKDFYENLADLKTNSFKDLTKSFAKEFNLNEENIKTSKRGRGRPKGSKNKTKKTTEIVNEE